MAINVPMPQLPLSGLNQAIATGGNLFSQMMNPVIQRENMQRQWKEHQQNLALQQAAQGRLAQMMPYQIQALKDAHAKAMYERDPEAQFAMMQKMMNLAGGMGQGQPQGQPGQQMPGQEMPQEQPAFPMMQGQGMPAMQPPEQAAPQADQMQSGMGAPAMPGGDMSNMSPLQLAIMKKFTGLDLGKETPNQKRYADLQAKIELENRKTANKAQAIQDKEVLSVQKDLPTLQKSLKGVDELLNIAKTNPDMFGHSFMPDRYAKTSKNKNFGRWQNLISDAIAGLEQKLSAKGNIVALKMAAQLKPSHGEQQEVAIGKLESMKQQLEDSIAHSNEIVGRKNSPQQSGQMDISKLSDEELQQIIAGGQ
tara:strand:+ start:25482 stop:26576 length:1095 start_codon:yes stop_codon:yes gene_type:complete